MLKNVSTARTGSFFKLIFMVYEFLWKLAAPILKLNKRLAQGYEQRMVQKSFPAADIWIQAASAGESGLVAEILKQFKPERDIKVLLTSITIQGLDILRETASAQSPKGSFLKVETGFFPFDKPSLMKKAVEQINPKLVIMIETEIWPGLLYSLRKNNIRTIILNGRITPASLNGYGYCPSLWPPLSPDRILAVSADDASKFSSLFQTDNVATMPNIKFDRIKHQVTGKKNNTLGHIVPEGLEFIVLGSVRKEEEEDILMVISTVLSQKPDSVIALFPRHLHRVKKWQTTLNKNAIPCTLRSEARKKTSGGTVIIGDLFGELVHAYDLATSVFVGGSLHKKGGGQNFLEPLASGVCPVIGPYWETFAWVGRKIITCGLVKEAENGYEVARLLLQEPGHCREAIVQKTKDYIENRGGGAAIAATEISKYI